jgi:hypothetical protein
MDEEGISGIIPTLILNYIKERLERTENKNTGMHPSCLCLHYKARSSPEL